ncbi:Gtr1/RagA G protein conserved region-domain-containing protein [Endogone sp. FLAS-F59071]|nr:Gtr1/RagA G protein conserved region-domain-containing protein [Endogone sp. FLAS-F59071]|eukprot:RUS18389.1 Gtr1/RagA G protein conserved region-domain-containing protein [Endogone sp. FLAS-F59071]
MPPNDTLYLESTSKIQKEDISYVLNHVTSLFITSDFMPQPSLPLLLNSPGNLFTLYIFNESRSFIDFQVWDFPGQIDFFDPTFDSGMIFGEVGALVFVIDAQDQYIEALSKLHNTVALASRVNPNIKFEVLIHKVDGLGDDMKIETQRDVQQRTNDELADAELEDIHLSFHLTSIYDHSIFEAFSKIIQKLISQLPTLEHLLNILCANSGIDKAYLFDTLTKIYIATDSSPVDMQSYEICSDMIDVLIDIECIYGPENKSLENGITGDEVVPAGAYTNGNGIGSSSGSIVDSVQSTGAGAVVPETEASSLIKLNNGTVLYLREVNRYLALICLLRSDNFEKHGLIDYNFQCFKEAITEVFELSNRRAQGSIGSMEAAT